MLLAWTAIIIIAVATAHALWRWTRNGFGEFIRIFVGMWNDKNMYQ
jgi:hypothetical protein